MTVRYLRIELPPTKVSFVGGLLFRLFGNRRSQSRTFILEFLDEHSEPAREIGLDAHGRVIFRTDPESKSRSKSWDGQAGFSDSQMHWQDFRDEFRGLEIEAPVFGEFWRAELAALR